MRKNAHVSILLLVASAAAAVDRPETRPAETPWGKAVDGLQCRLVVRPEYCRGQAVAAAVEIRNVSKKTRYPLHLFDIERRKQARLTVTGPAGKPLKQTRWSSGGHSLSLFKPIEPGGSVRTEMFDLRTHFRIAAAGKYTLVYTYVGPKMTQRYVAGERTVAGRREKICQSPTPEQQAGAWAGTLTSNTATFTLSDPAAADLTVHEWGVFTVYPDMKLANAGRRAEWESLPKDFYRQFPTRRLHWIPAAWDKPVLYFYTRRSAMQVKVKVSFAEGAPVVWWPACSAPIDDNTGRKTKPFRALEWSAWLGEVVPPDLAGTHRAPGRPRPTPASEFDLPKDCWLTQARAVPDAALVSVRGTKLARGRPWASGRCETERFIYYDGLVPAPDFLRCIALTGESITLANAAKFPISGLLVIDRRAGMRVATCAAIRPGKSVVLPLKPPGPGAGPAGAARTEMRRQLTAAGLTAAETAAVLKIWRKGFFERPGVTGLYLLPRAEYDRMLPLTIEPQPAKLVRVGVALHPDLRPPGARAARVRELIAQLDSDDFKRRRAASDELARMGPAVAPLLREALRTSKSVEVRTRCERILAGIDASEYLKPAGGN